MILFEKSYGLLEFDEDIPAVIAHFTTHMTSIQFRNFLLLGVNFIEEKFKELNREVVWIANTKKHTVQPNEDTQWVSDVWNPKAFKAGVRHAGFIIPEKLFGLASVENYLRNNYRREEMSLDIMLFNELENAKRWYKKLLQNEYVKQKQKKA